MPKPILTLILVLACTGAWGQAYKWRDANGNTQYSDVPPPAGARDVQQLRRPGGGGGTPPATDASKSYAEKDAEFRKRTVEKQESEAKQAKANEDEQVRKRNCEQAQGQLAALDTGQRMVRLTASGERLALDDNERAVARADAVKAVESWCK